jgi:von Willebrand factor type A domain
MRFGQYIPARGRRIRTRLRLIGGMVATGLTLLSHIWAQERPSRLELADKVRMIEEGDGSSRPFFRVQFNVVDDQGSPISIAPPKDFAEVFEVAESSGAIHRPLALRYGQETISQVPSSIPNHPNQRYALLLIDISGSMLDSSGEGSQIEATKYSAAKTAAQRFLTGFQSGQDHIAVVPFESHQVRERVNGAIFAEDIQTAERQLAELPVPQRHYNTGLYSAVDSALDVLAEIKRQNPAAGVLLVVLTDGQNQVLKGDDVDLLTGTSGLEAVVAEANVVGSQIMTIGFGDESVPAGRKGAIDVEALRRLAWPNSSHFHAAQDVQSLGTLFGVARELLVNRWQLTFTTHREDRSELAGQDLQFQIRLRLGGRVLQSSWVAFKTPQMSAPPFEGRLDAAERQALTQISANFATPRSTSSARTVAVRRALIFAGFGGLLAFLWFAVPLTLWPSRTATLPKKSALTSMPSLDQLPVQHQAEQTPTQLESHGSSPDRTMFDPRGQQTLVLNPDQSIKAELPGKTEIQVSRPEDTSPVSPPVPAGPDSTLILDRFPDQAQPSQTQIQFSPLPQRNSLDRTLFDPRGQQKIVLKPDKTIIDPRGEQTVILPPQDKPPTKT